MVVDPFTLAILAKILFTGAVVVLTYLSVTAVRNWFREQRTERHIAGAAVLMKEKLANGNYRVCAGLFKDGEFGATNVWESKSLDPKLAGLRDGDVIVDPQS